MAANWLESLLTLVTGGSKSNSKKVPSVPVKAPEATPAPVAVVDDGYYHWKKGETLTLSKYFSTDEFSCHCSFADCVDQKVTKSLITKLDSVRTDIKEPLVVTSAYRCTKYQAKLRDDGVNTVVATTLSQHELGKAADIHPKSRTMKGFEAICAKYFDSIGVANTFLHVDERTDKKNRRWKY